MIVDMDKYMRNFRIFYAKMVASHPQKLQLEKKFKFLLQNQVNKSRNGLFTLNKSQNSIKSYMNKTKSMQTKTNTSKIKHQWLIQTSDFTRALLFGWKQKQAIKLIRQKLEQLNVFVQGKLFEGSAFRKVVFAWSKIQKLFVNKFVVKPYSTISDCLNDVCSEFIDILYKVFTQGKIQKLQPASITQQRLKKLSHLIKINLTYFQLSNQIKLIKKTGDNKKNINLGYLIDENIFVIAKELPKKQKDDQQQDKLINKMTIIGNQINKIFEETDIRINGLDAVMTAKQGMFKAVGKTIEGGKKLGKLRRSDSLNTER